MTTTLQKSLTYKRLVLTGLISLMGAVIAFILFHFNPANSQLFPPCPVHALTGFYCPGCGSLRALHLLSHGQLTAAFKMNPLLVVSLPVLGLLLCNPRGAHHTWTPWFALAILVGFGLLRNIPCWPFELLAPR